MILANRSVRPPTPPLPCITLPATNASTSDRYRTHQVPRSSAALTTSRSVTTASKKVTFEDPSSLQQITAQPSNGASFLGDSIKILI
ncbi:unnamed protein product [Anisakis simplex]|uniref:Uncharacterized protein n=1 Tax=Anisakis simplex TaxID=6269 RepID=A0A0M3J9C7_ANISI|nr:unnamed protein product [Anisakis simplex]